MKNQLNLSRVACLLLTTALLSCTQTSYTESDWSSPLEAYVQVVSYPRAVQISETLTVEMSITNRSGIHENLCLLEGFNMSFGMHSRTVTATHFPCKMNFSLAPKEKFFWTFATPLKASCEDLPDELKNLAKGKGCLGAIALSVEFAVMRIDLARQGQLKVTHLSSEPVSIKVTGR